LLYEYYVSDNVFSFLDFMFSQSAVLKCKKRRRRRRRRRREGWRTDTFDFTHVTKFLEAS
jgi:hypothetical protein